MIRGFANRATQRLFDNDACPAQWRAFKSIAVRKLDTIDAATKVEDLRSPPGNRLEGLKGDRKGQWSIRNNRQWRICFRWADEGPDEVEIVDYHGGMSWHACGPTLVKCFERNISFLSK